MAVREDAAFGDRRDPGDGGVRSGAACEAEVAGSAGSEVVSGLVVPHVPSSPSWTQT